MSSLLTGLACAAGGLAATNFFMAKKDKNLSFKRCLHDKLLLPVVNMADNFLMDNTLEVLEICDDHLVVNTHHKTLYAIELTGVDSIENYIDENALSSLYDLASRDPKGYFYQAIFKDESYQKQYIFSYSKDIIGVLSKYFDIDILKGEQVADVLFDLFLGNSFYIKDKKIHRQLNISEDVTMSFLPVQDTFNKVVKNNIYNNIKSARVYYGYKVKKKIDRINYNKLYELDFKGVIWGYYDFSKARTSAFAKKTLDERKFYGGKEPFVELVNQVENKNKKLMVVNFEFISKDSTISTINQISEILGVSFAIKRNKLIDSITSTPIKHRDTRFDLPVELDFITNRIGTAHKRSAKEPDFFGYDLKNSHVNFSLSEENEAPHSIIIAPTGSGKSVAKQKIVGQMLDLDLVTGYAPKLGLTSGKYGIRNFDVGYSDFRSFKKIQSNKHNNTGEIKSDLNYFKYNIFNIEKNDKGEPLVEDVQFATDLISMILESGSSSKEDGGLTSAEVGLLREAILDVFANENLIDKQKIRSIKETHPEIYDELTNELGYQDLDSLWELREEKYSFFKVPLLEDIIRYVSPKKNSKQIDNNDVASYATLTSKLKTIEKLGYFSSYDNLKISDTAYLYSELNSIKETSLFVPLFFGIFWKVYTKDRARALEMMLSDVPRPKLIYLIEESSNFFRFKVFITMFEKLVFEARKYNIHLMFILQNANDVPETIMQNINTKMFLFPANQKASIIKYLKTTYSPEQKVIDTMESSKIYNLVVWYSKGVFTTRFDYTDYEFKFYSTNPNQQEKAINGK